MPVAEATLRIRLRLHAETTLRGISITPTGTSLGAVTIDQFRDTGHLCLDGRTLGLSRSMTGESDVVPNAPPIRNFSRAKRLSRFERRDARGPLVSTESGTMLRHEPVLVDHA